MYRYVSIPSRNTSSMIIIIDIVVFFFRPTFANLVMSHEMSKAACNSHLFSCPAASRLVERLFRDASHQNGGTFFEYQTCSIVPKIRGPGVYIYRYDDNMVVSRNGGSPKWLVYKGESHV